MIQSIRCAGYKAFDLPLKLDLRPITVFFGKNNAGKTTLARLPIQAAASLSNTDSFYALSFRDIIFGQSFGDLANVSDPHPAVHLGVEWSPGRKMGITLQHVASQEAPDTVQPVFIQVDAYQRRIGLRRPPAQSMREIIDGNLSPAARRNLEHRTDALRDLLNNLIHISSYRPAVESVYSTRNASAWTAAETPYILSAHRPLLDSVGSWFRHNLDGAGVDIDQAAFAFRIVETRDNFVTNFAHSGRGPQSLLPIVTMLKAIITEVSRPQLVVVEEPEVHVHPSVHGAIADLLIACASKTQVVVETHSENLLLRLRRRVAEHKLSREDLALYFVDDKHAVQDISIDEFGSTNQWPTGVFENDIEEAQAIVAAKIAAMAELDVKS